MSKKQKAIEIFSKMSDYTRPDVIKVLMSELDMSEVGASTYYYQAQKHFRDLDDNDDGLVAQPKTWWTICTLGTNEDGHIIVAKTNTYSVKEHALRDADETECVVEGIPEIGTLVVNLTD